MLPFWHASRIASSETVASGVDDARLPLLLLLLLLSPLALIRALLVRDRS
jgi:hypothetical protein